MKKLKGNDIYGWLMILVPVFSGYAIFSIPVAYIFYAIGVLFMLIEFKTMNINRNICIFAVFASAVTVIQSKMLDISIRICGIRLAIFLFFLVNVFIVAYKTIDLKKTIEFYKMVCYILSALIMVQYLFYILGHPFSLILPNMLTATDDNLATNVYRETQVLTSRFSTFFLEPAHQAQYVLPGLALVLFEKDNFGSFQSIFFRAVWISVGVICTTSMQGMLGMAILWIYYLYKLFRSRNMKNFQRLVVIVPILLLMAFVIGRQPILQEQIQKKWLSFKGLSSGINSSMYLRMFVGWDCFKDVDFAHKLFGCGTSTAGNFLLSSGIGNKYYTNEIQIGYMSGASKMFVEYGICGTLFFLAGIKSKIGNGIKKNQIRALLLVWLILMFTSDCFISLTTLMILTFIFAGQNQYISEKGGNDASV